MPDEFGNPTDDEILAQLLTEEPAGLTNLAKTPPGFQLKTTAEGLPFYMERPDVITPPEKAEAAPTPDQQLEALKPTPAEVLQSLAPTEPPPPLAEELKAPPRKELAALLENLPEPKASAEAPPLSEAPPSEAPKEEKKPVSAEEVLANLSIPFFIARKATEPERQAIAKPAGALAALPWIVGALPSVGGALTDPDAANRENAKRNAAFMIDQAGGAYKAMHTIFQAELEPETPAEYVGGVLGGLAGLPGKAAMVLGGGLMALDWLKGEPVLKQAPKMSKELADLLLTPAEAATPDPFANVPTTGTFIGAAGEANPATPPATGPAGDFVAPSPESIIKKPRPPMPRKKDKPGEFEARYAEWERKDAEWRKQLNPTAVSTIETVGGLRQVKDADLWGIGIMGMATFGMVTLPYVGAGMRNVLFPKAPSSAEVGVRPVPGGPEGLITGVRPTDLFRANVDSINLATVRLAERAQIPVDKVEKLETLLRTSGFGQGKAQLDGAIQYGRMESPTVVFEAPMPLPQLDAWIKRTPNAKQYLITRDIMEEINVRESMVKHRGNKTTEQIAKELEEVLPGLEVEEVLSAKGPPIVNGLTKEQALDMLKAYEGMNPELRKIGEAWDGWNRARRETQAGGEAATLRKGKDSEDVGSQKYLNVYRKSEVPFYGKRSKGMSFEDRVSHTNITDALAERTRAALKERNHNEIRLTTVDSFNETGQKYFIELTPQELDAHPEWKPYVTEVKRRGEVEYHASDGTTRQFMYYDPYADTQGLGLWMSIGKRGVESWFTGNLNPLFSIKNAFRVWHGAKLNNLDPNLRNPSIWGMSKGVVEQLYPQLGKWFAEEIENGGGKRLTQFFGAMTGKDEGQARAAVEAIGRQSAMLWDQSTVAMIQRAGGAHGSTYMEQQLRAKIEGELRRADIEFGRTSRGRQWLEAYKSTVGAIHEAPMYDFVSKNLHLVREGKITMPELLAKARDLGGDPKIAGQYYVMKPLKGGGFQPERLQFESDSKLLNAVAATMRPLGVGAEIVRHGPWGNAIIQSVKRVGAAYLEDPIGFTKRMWLYSILPSGVEYMWNYSLGKDPNGKSYVDYGVDGRTTYASLTNRYWAIPGRPAEEGIQLPWIALELGLPHAITQRALHHAFGSAKLDLRDDMTQAMWAAMDISVNIPAILPLSAWELYKGRIPPMNIFGGEQVKIKRDPFDQYIGMPESIERFLRLVGPIGGAVGGAWAAYTHTEDGFANAMKNAVSEVHKPFTRQVPFHEVLFPESTFKTPGTNKVIEKMYENQDAINEITNHFRTVMKNRGVLNVKPRSEKGGEVSTMWLGPPLPGRIPGPAQPEPNDPTYLKFMDYMYGFFKRDNPGFSQKGEDLGGVGFLSIGARYGQATRALKSMQHVDDGLQVTWQRWMNAPEQEEVKANLIAHKVDPANPRQVRNYLENVRQEAGLLLYQYQRAAEITMGVKLKDLKPYGPMTSAPGEFFTGAEYGIE